MKYKGQNGLDSPEQRDWILANYDQASTYKMSKYLGINESTIVAYIKLIGVNNVESVVKTRGLKHDIEYERWLFTSCADSKFEKMWNEHAIAEVAEILDCNFPAVVYKARKRGLYFSAAKEKEIAVRAAEAKMNKYNHHVEHTDHYEAWGLNGSGCVNRLNGIARCNGYYIK